MTHWFIEDYGSGPVIFVCANCGHKTKDPYENGINYETCSGCGLPINSSKNEYVMKVAPEDCNGWIPVIEEAHWIPNILDLSKRVVYKCPHCKQGHGRIVIEKNYEFCPHCGTRVECDLEDK